MSMRVLSYACPMQTGHWPAPKQHASLGGGICAADRPQDWTLRTGNCIGRMALWMIDLQLHNLL